MSITRLQQARQMYALGQRAAKTLDGSRPGYRGSDYGDEARGTGAYSGQGQTSAPNTGNNSGPTGNPNNQDDGTPYGAASKPYDPTTSVDNRLAYNTPTGRFSPMNKSTRTQMGNFRNQMQKTIQPGLPMAVKLGLGTIFPGAGQIAEYFYNKNYYPFGYSTTSTTFPDGGGGDPDGITTLPNMLDVAGPVVEDETGDGEMEDFIQRYRVDNELRQDKEGQLDPAILEMISKLYT